MHATNTLYEALCVCMCLCACVFVCCVVSVCARTWALRPSGAALLSKCLIRTRQQHHHDVEMLRRHAKLASISATSFPFVTIVHDQTIRITTRPFVARLSSWRARQTLVLPGSWARPAPLAAASSKCKQCHDQDLNLWSQAQLHPQCTTRCRGYTCGTTASTLTATRAARPWMRQQLGRMW